MLKRAFKPTPSSTTISAPGIILKTLNFLMNGRSNKTSKAMDKTLITMEPGCNAPKAYINSESVL